MAFREAVKALINRRWMDDTRFAAYLIDRIKEYEASEAAPPIAAETPGTGGEAMIPVEQRGAA